MLCRERGKVGEREEDMLKLGSACDRHMVSYVKGSLVNNKRG